MFHSVSLFSQAPLARGSRALPSVLLKFFFLERTISGVMELLEMTFKGGIIAFYLMLFWYTITKTKNTLSKAFSGEE